MLPPGSGTGIPVQVRTRGGLLSPTVNAPVLDYDAPNPTLVVPAHALAGTTVSNVSVCGSNMGNSNADVTFVRIGGLPCTALRRANASCIVCDSVDATNGWLAGHADEVEVMIAGQTSGLVSTLFAGVPFPRIASITPTYFSSKTTSSVRLIKRAKPASEIPEQPEMFKDVRLPR